MKKHYNAKENHPFFGKFGNRASNFKDGRTLKIYYCIGCGKEISYQVALYGKGRCRSCTMKKRIRDNPFLIKGMCEKHHTKKAKEKLRKAHKGTHHTVKTKRKISKASKGSQNAMFGKPCPNAKKTKYKDIWMRSSWEAKFAQFLTLSGIEWLYEPKRFDLGELTYLPDFYIPEWDLYIEIKGWFYKQDKRKIKLFKKKFPKMRIKVLLYNELKELGVIL